VSGPLHGPLPERLSRPSNRRLRERAFEAEAWARAYAWRCADAAYAEHWVSYAEQCVWHVMDGLWAEEALRRREMGT
jgi:hypothetical protein